MAVVFKHSTNPKQNLNTTWSYLSRGSHGAFVAFPILSFAAATVTVTAEPPSLAALPPDPPRLKDEIRRRNPAMKTARGQSPFLCFTLLGAVMATRAQQIYHSLLFIFSFCELSVPCCLVELWCFVHFFCLLINASFLFLDIIMLYFFLWSLI